MGFYAEHAIQSLLEMDVEDYYYDTYMMENNDMATVKRQRGGTRKKTTRKKTTRKKTTRKKATKAALQEVPTSTGLSILLYGPSGVGKTSLAANLPNVMFITDPHEEGILDLVAYKQCPPPKIHSTVGGWEELIDALSNIPDGVDNVVLDSLTGFQHMCFTYCCETDYDGDWSSRGFYSFQQGPATAATRYWEPEFIHACNNVIRRKVNITLLAHSEIKRFEDPTTSAYERYQPLLHKQTWALTHRWVKCVLFYNYYTDLVTPEGSQRKKPDMDSESRYIYTQHSAAFDAKNRFGMAPMIPAGESAEEAYQNLAAAISTP